MVKYWYYQNVQYVIVKKSKFINQQEAKGLLSKWGIKTLLSKIPILDDILFWMHTCLKTLGTERRIKMNEIVNKYLLVGDKFMPENAFKATRIYL